MTKATLSFFLCLLIPAGLLIAQPQTREELEKQRQALKKEIEQTEKQLKSTRAEKQKTFVDWKLINKKLTLQDRVIDNINRDLSLLDRNIAGNQREIRKYDRLLDTLKQEYARSMVYAYKNRSNYEFLNFVFSSANFNDAMKRLAYLKSYRNYREMQGENILRTQAMKKTKIQELNGVKEKKNTTLEVQSKELNILAEQQKEKDRILADLKKQEKKLNAQMAAKRKQMQKVDNAIAAAIKRAQREAIAKAAEEERKRNLALKTEKSASTPKSSANPETPTKTAAVRKPAESILLNDASTIALNASFEKNRGSLPWPVDRGMVLMHYGANKLPSGSVLDVTSINISSDIGSAVKAVFDGTVSAVQTIEDMQVVIIQHGRYFTSYSNLSGVGVQKGQSVKTGQTIGRVAANFDGIGAIDFYISNETSNFDPERWLRRR